MARATGPGRRLRGRPASARRGARRTTRTDTVISWRLYRAGWLAVLPALLLMLVAARTPATLPAATLPETFDGAEALGYTTEFVTANPDRAPGSGGAQRAADWLADRLEAVRPALHVSRDRFQATDAGGGQVELENVLAVVPGESNEAVILLARRDGKSPGPGADYSGSGTGLLLAMATALAGTTSAKTFVLASVDGSLLANAGARRLAQGLPDGLRAVAAVALDGGGRDLPVALRIEGDDARRPAAGLVRSAETALVAHGIGEIAPPGAGEQLARFYTPLGIGPQAAFVTDAVPSVALDRADDDLSPTRDTLRALSADELGDFGSSGQALAFALAEGPRPVSHGATYVLSGDRVVRGWTIQLLILSLLVPPGLVLLDLIVRGRRRGLPLRPALRAVGLRTLPPLAFVVALRLEGALGAFSGPHEPPFPLGAAGVRPIWLIVPALAAIGAVAWARPRRQTVPGDPAEAGLAAYTAALTAAGVAAFLLELGGGYPAVVAAVALHVWLALPALAPAGAAVRLGAVALGWAGLAAVIALTAAPGGLGGGAPGWLVRLAGSGAIPFAAAAGIAVLAGATAALVAIVVARGGESGRSGLQ